MVCNRPTCVLCAGTGVCHTFISKVLIIYVKFADVNVIHTGTDCVIREETDRYIKWGW